MITSFLTLCVLMLNIGISLGAQAAVATIVELGVTQARPTAVGQYPWGYRTSGYNPYYGVRPFGRPLTSKPSPAPVNTPAADGIKGGDAEDTAVTVASGGVNYDGDGANGGRIAITRVPGGISEARIDQRAVEEGGGEMDSEKHGKPAHHGKHHHKPGTPHAQPTKVPVNGSQGMHKDAIKRHRSGSKAPPLPTTVQEVPSEVTAMISTA